MRIAVPTPLELAGLLARSLGSDARPRRLPIADPTPDPGLFGPGSVTWRVMREPLLILGGGRALLMQAAHPLVAQGAIEHSGFASDPFGRLERTLVWVTAVTFGTTAEAHTASREVNRLHRAVSGALPRSGATRRVGAGTQYSASDSELLLWVHATFVDTMIETHEALIGGLSSADRERFVREWDAVARLMRVPAPLLWRDHADMRAYITRQLREGPVHPGAGSRRVCQTIVRPPLPSPVLRPAWDAVAFATVGLLPAELRRDYGVRWTPAHDAAHQALRVALRTAHPLTPRRLRGSPVHDFAQARVRGELRTAA
jgi:uncharacterized protein (DUF2236 family)